MNIQKNKQKTLEIFEKEILIESNEYNKDQINLIN
jgi:hypothetical protein